MRKENKDIHWGMDRCWRCKGEGKILVPEELMQSSSLHEEERRVRECPNCYGEGIVPKC